MARGTYAGFGASETGLTPLLGGTWNMGQGRVTTDEFRGFGYPDNIPATISGGGAGSYPGGQRFVPVPRQLNPFFPGDAGSLFNLCNGTYAVPGVAPFTAAYNAAGVFNFLQSSTANFSILENNQVYQSTPRGTNLPICSTVVGAPLYIGIVAGSTISETVKEITSATNFSGTLTVTRLNNYESLAQLFGGATLNTRAGYHVQDTGLGTGGGTAGTTIGLDIDPLTTATTNIGVRIFAATQTFTTSYPNAIAINNGGNATLNFTNASFGNLITISGTFQYQQNGAGLASGSGYVFSPTIKNLSSVSGGTIGLATGFGYSPTYQADSHPLTIGIQIGLSINPTANIVSGGTLSLTGIRGIGSQATIGTGVTVTAFQHFLMSDLTNTGTVTLQVGLDIATLAAGTTNIGVRLGAMPNPLQMGVTTTGPTTGNLTSNTNAVFTVYHGTTNYYFLIAFNDGGTVRYIYAPLNGSTTPVTWTTATTLPT